MAVTIDGTTGITSPAIDVTTPVTTTDGGTGLSSFTADGAMYATSTSALTTGTLPVASGGTGATSLTANNVLLGNGTSALQLVAPGSSGNVLTSNGTTWTSAAAAGGSIQTQVFSAPGTWTKPSTVTQVRVTVVGGGGGSGMGTSGGIAGSAGSTSSFGPLVSATGGGAGQGGPAAPGTPGAGSVSAPATAIRTSYIGLNNLTSANPVLISINSIAGQLAPTGTASATTWSTSSNFMAGIGGSAPSSSNSLGGSGGYAIAIVPVSAPVAVTVGAGGSGAPTIPVSGSVSGAVLVEWVG